MHTFDDAGRPDRSGLEERDDLHDHALRSIAVAQLGRVQTRLARIQLETARRLSAELRAVYRAMGVESHEVQRAIAVELSETIARLAKEQRLASSSVSELVSVLHAIIDEARLTREIRLQLEPEVVLCGIKAFFAA